MYLPKYTKVWSHEICNSCKIISFVANALCVTQHRQFNLSLPQNSPKNATHDYGDWGLAQARVFETWRLVSYWTK